MIIFYIFLVTRWYFSAKFLTMTPYFAIFPLLPIIFVIFHSNFHPFKKYLKSPMTTVLRLFRYFKIIIILIYPTNVVKLHCFYYLSADFQKFIVSSVRCFIKNLLSEFLTENFICSPSLRQFSNFRTIFLEQFSNPGSYLLTAISIITGMRYLPKYSFWYISFSILAHSRSYKSLNFPSKSPTLPVKVAICEFFSFIKFFKSSISSNPPSTSLPYITLKIASLSLQ